MHEHVAVPGPGRSHAQGRSRSPLCGILSILCLERLFHRLDECLVIGLGAASEPPHDRTVPPDQELVEVPIFRAAAGMMAVAGA